MASFKGNSKLILMEGDEGISFLFELTQCSSRTANDGFLPYGIDATAVETFIYLADDSTACLDFNIIDSITDNNITLTLDYPEVNGPGKYTVVFKLTLDGGSIIHARFDRLFVESLPGDH